jgi:ABC-type Fe3+/spermidine/putrescine transport system ATPase subunit
VLVTHEQEEAFDLADRIALLHLGRLEQVGTPEALYHAPSTPFVAGFVGRASRLRGTVTGYDGDRVRVRAAGIEWHPRGDLKVADEVVLLLRPDAVRLVGASPLGGRVVHRRFAGASAFYTVRVAGDLDIEIAASADAAREGDAVHLEPTGTGAHAWCDPRPLTLEPSVAAAQDKRPE